MNGNRSIILLLVFGGLLTAAVLGFSVYSLFFQGEVASEEAVVEDEVSNLFLSTYADAIVNYTNEAETDVELIAFKRCSEFNCVSLSSFERRLYLQYNTAVANNYLLVCDETSTESNPTIFSYTSELEIRSAINNNECFK